MTENVFWTNNVTFEMVADMPAALRSKVCVYIYIERERVYIIIYLCVCRICMCVFICVYVCVCMYMVHRSMCVVM